MDRYLKIFLTLIAISMMIVGTMAPAMAVSSKAYCFEDNLEVALPNVAYELPYVPGEIVVQFNPGVSEAKINAMNSKNGATVTYTSKYADFKVLKIPKTKSVEEMVEIYSKNPNVKSASANSIAYAMTVDDPYYSIYQWNFYTEYGINVEPAWDISTGSGAIVAVLDTGVAYSDSYDSYANYDLADTNFVQGYDFVNGDNDPADDNGHGTHVTGTIAQSTDNGIGVAGIAYDCSIMPVKILNKRGSGTLQQIVDGIYYASNNSADVISMSLGWPPGTDPDGVDGILDGALDYAHTKGVTIVAAAGNDETGIVSYPAADDNCIAVGATSFDGDLAYYSNWGTEIDVVAPGGDMSENLFNPSDNIGDGILQCTFGSKTPFAYVFYQGTSMATPHVAGVAALLISNCPSASNDQIRQAIESSARNLGEDGGWDSTYGYGLINAEAALYRLDVITGTAPVISSVELSPDTPNVGDYIDVTVHVTDNIGVTSVTADDVELSFQTGDEWTGTITADQSNMVTVTAEDAAGNIATDKVSYQDPTSTAPVIDSIVLSDIEPNTGDSIVITVHVTDTEGDVISVTADGDSLNQNIENEEIWMGSIIAINGDNTVTVTATDAAGNTATSSVLYTATTQDTTPDPMYATVTCSASRVNKIMYTATAIVTIVNETGGPVEKATVYGEFTVPGEILPVSGVTDGNGVVEISSGNYKATSNAVSFTVTDVNCTGYIYYQ